MELIILAALLALAGWWVFREGKRLGSRKGYGAGRGGRKRHRR